MDQRNKNFFLFHFRAFWVNWDTLFFFQKCLLAQNASEQDARAKMLRQTVTLATAIFLFHRIVILILITPPLWGEYQFQSLCMLLLLFDRNILLYSHNHTHYSTLCGFSFSLYAVFILSFCLHRSLTDWQKQLSVILQNNRSICLFVTGSTKKT